MSVYMYIIKSYHKSLEIFTNHLKYHEVSCLQWQEGFMFPSMFLAVAQQQLEVAVTWLHRHHRHVGRRGEARDLLLGGTLAVADHAGCHGGIRGNLAAETSGHGEAGNST